MTHRTTERRTDHWSTLTRALPFLLAALSVSGTIAQTYVFQRQFDPGLLDPLNIYSPWGQNVIENVYEGLYEYSGPEVGFTPVLATNFTISDDQLTYTFQLRDGVRFHSGNEFGCKDVAYSIRRALIVDPGLVGQSLLGGAGTALEELGPNASDAEYAGFWRRIANSVSCVDDRTLTVRSQAPDPILFGALMSPSYYVVDSAAVIENGGWDGTEATWRDLLTADLSEGYLSGKASGTGPYEIVSWEPGARLVAERNPDYWGEAPQVKTVVYEVVPDEAVRIEALKAGRVDQIDLRMTLPSELEGQPGIRVLNGGAGSSAPEATKVVGAIFLNQHMAAADNPFIGSGELDGNGVPANFFSDVDVRKCFSYAWNNGEDDLENAPAGAFYPTMLLVPVFAAYDPEIPRYRFDLAKAEEHCRAAWGGKLWEMGMRLGGPSDDWITEAYKETLEAMNPKFRIDLVELTDEQSDLAWAEMQLPWGNAAGYSSFPDAYEFMADWYQSSTSVSADFGYANGEIDRLIAQARTEFDTAKRDELYRRVGRLAYEDAPFVLLPSRPSAFVVSDKVSGVHRPPMFAGIRWSELRKPE